jgi:hypothetical protein
MCRDCTIRDEYKNRIGGLRRQTETTERDCSYPVNPENLTVLENTLIEQNDIVAITKEIFAGAITAKHAGCLCAGIVLFVTVSGDTVAKIAASLA